MKKLLFTALAALLLFSCNKKEDEDENPGETPVAQTGSIRLMFDNAYDSEVVSFTTPFVTASSDTIQITSLKYIISDVTFTDADGNMVMEPNSYHIVEASGTEDRWSTLIENVPAGSYTNVTFKLGVAQDRFSDLSLLLDNHTQEEADDMIKADMSGYYNLKIEGTFSSDQGTSGALLINNQSMTQAVEYEFGEAPSTDHSNHDMHMRVAHAGEEGKLDVHVMQDSITQVHFQANLAMMFDMPVAIDFDESTHLSSLNALIHNNYANGLFMLHHSKFE